MKTLELKLKKDVLIVDLPNIDVNSKPKIIQDSFGFWIYFKIKGHKPAKIEIPHTFFDYKNYKNYEFLCKGSELTEEIASELCHNIGNSLTIIGNAYLDDVNDLYFWEYAIDAFITSVESKDFYWLKNPYKQDAEQWQEAEEKTFKNPLIFVKK